jgi:hypothetical protein
MASTPTVNKSECCRRFGWSRYQFDLNAFAGMPVVEAARHKGAEWRVDPKAVARWVAERKAEEIARQRRLQEAYAARKREAERKVAAMLARKYDQERAQREAAKRREAEWREREAKRQKERWLDQAYGHCKRCAHRDIGSPKGPDWVHRTPHWSADWPVQRPSWWLPPPGLLEAVMAEPACIPYGHQEPDWRRWVPTYVPGRPWPWRADTVQPDTLVPAANSDAPGRPSGGEQVLAGEIEDQSRPALAPCPA